MTLLLVLNSIFFVATLTEYLIFMKYITNNYGYKNEWFNVLLSLVFTPFYSCFFIRNFSWQRAKAYFAPERRAVLKYPVLTGVLYTVETVFVFYALNTVTLSYYTILRSGFIIFNIPWFKFLLKKPVTRLYYASCTALVVSHALATGQYILQYNDSGDGDGNVVQNTVIIFASCFLNSAYNNIIEYAMKLHGNTMSNLDFQAMFQATYFALSAPWAVFYTVKHTPPVTVGSMTMYFFIAFGLQLYMFNKIYILNTPQTVIPANILLSGLDLIRRVIQLTYSFVCFKEPFDAMIGLSLVFLGLSGGLLLYQYIRDYHASNGREVAMDAVGIDTDAESDKVLMLSSRTRSDADNELETIDSPV
jgi:drug/metabolite transporter (DMT)-like permease